MNNRREQVRLLERARSLEAMAAHQNTQIDEDFLLRMAQEAREEATALWVEEERDAAD